MGYEDKIMKYNKLVRDKIPEYIQKKGGNPITHIADDAEYWQKLKEKLIEEIEEFKKDENIEEFADLLEVIEAIADYKKFDRDEVERVRNKKAEERGKFRDKIILDES
jgi:predicted house-cleaning noncanonical NTP pyrophosphatase (MazG superfamily)